MTERDNSHAGPNKQVSSQSIKRLLILKAIDAVIADLEKIKKYIREER